MKQQIGINFKIKLETAVFEVSMHGKFNLTTTIQLAQLVEHQTTEWKVTGSNSGGPTQGVFK